MYVKRLYDTENIVAGFGQQDKIKTVNNKKKVKRGKKRRRRRGETKGEVIRGT